MGNMGLRIRGGGEADELGSVTGWLEMVTVEEGEQEREKERAKCDPITPPRSVVLQERYEEVSPTDTTFSSDSVFDTPERRDAVPSSPCPNRRLRDDVSEITSYDEDEQPLGATKEKVADQLAQPNFTFLRLQPGSLHSYEPLSDDEDLEEPPIVLSAPPPRDPNAPRIVNLVSCLQCTLANLPCSRTTPSCTRCIRKCNTHTCLLQRRRFHEEIIYHGSNFCTQPVLLKLKSEDAEIRRKKLELAQELHEVWQERHDKKNWVMPRVGSEKRGNWKAAEYVGRKAHPGEGLGRVTWAELRVETEMNVETF